MPFCAYLVHGLNPVLIRFPESWPVGGIYWYGIAYIVAFFAIYIFIFTCGRFGRLPFPRSQVVPFLSAVAAGAVVGGRIGYELLYDFAALMADPLELFRIWRGGMSSHGGFVGVAVAILVHCRRNGISALAAADLIAASAPLGLFIGRIANFVNGELYGKPSTVPWAVIFPNSAPPHVPLEFVEPRHPSQLYEALLEGVLLFALCQWRFWVRPPKHSGRLCGEFLCAYAIVRIVVEFFREPDAPPIFSMSRGQFYSIFIFKLGVTLIAISCRRRR
ncbi:MAG: prolipoprotein diacylglyceryl transferase [Puniceicoccales bacterium]|nr:prolipoprotein diacylglyceryl transferase [Puniceicoccales bacterium]